MGDKDSIVLLVMLVHIISFVKYCNIFCLLLHKREDKNCILLFQWEMSGGGCLRITPNFISNSNVISHQHWNIYPICAVNLQLFVHYKILVKTKIHRECSRVLSLSVVTQKVTKNKSTRFMLGFVLILKKRV